MEINSEAVQAHDSVITENEEEEEEEEEERRERRRRKKKKKKKKKKNLNYNNGVYMLAHLRYVIIRDIVQCARINFADLDVCI